MAEQPTTNPVALGVGLGLALGAGLGVSLGAAIGALTGNLAIWISLGTPIGAGIGLLIGLCWTVIVAQPKPEGVCAHCGYSTKGLRSRVCPECGGKLDDAEPKRPDDPR